MTIWLTFLAYFREIVKKIKLVITIPTCPVETDRGVQIAIGLLSMTSNGYYEDLLRILRFEEENF